MKRALVWKLLRKFLLISSASILISGCASTRPVANDFCIIAKPIPNSMKNIEATRRAVDSHNAVGVSLCGW